MARSCLTRRSQSITLSYDHRPKINQEAAGRATETEGGAGAEARLEIAAGHEVRVVRGSPEVLTSRWSKVSSPDDEYAQTL